MSNYQTLDAWQMSIKLVKEIYIITAKYPREELYSLTSQTKRAALSVPSNIAEGMGRQYRKDTLQFQYIARGSLYELETLLFVAKTLGIINEVTFDKMNLMTGKTIQVLNGLINYLENSNLK